MIGVIVKVPLVANVPADQPDPSAFAFPPVVHELAFCDVQVIVSDVSAGTEAEPRVSVGAAGAVSAGVTVKTTLAEGDTPPRLAQMSEKVSVPTAVGLIVMLPLAASVPLQLPDAVQLVAPLESHAMVVDLPTSTDEDEKFTFGLPGGVPEVTLSMTELAACACAALVQVSA